MTQPFNSPLRRLSASPVAAADDRRTISYTFSTGDVAQDRHKLLQSGWDLSYYNQIGAPLDWSHDTGQPSIGRVINLGVKNNALRGSVVYADAETYPFADTTYRLVKGKFISSTSVAFLPTEGVRSTDPKRPGGWDFSKQKLVGIAQCVAPSDAGAVADARSAGINLAPLIDWAEQQLDEGSNAMPRHELEVIRRAAGAPRLYAAPQRDAAREAREREARAVAARGKAIEMGRPVDFRIFGEFAQSVARSAAAGNSTTVDPRLTRATGLTEDSAPDGGLAIPSVFLNEIVPEIFAGSVVGQLVDLRETERPLADVSIPGFAEVTRADGGRLGGVVSAWLNDGTSIPTSFPRFSNINFSGNSIFVAVIATSELASDAPLLGSYLKEAITSELGFRLDQAIVTGPGTPGRPLGIVNAPATIIIPKQNGQAPGTIVRENIQNAWARMPGPLRRRAIWAGNSDVETILDTGEFSGVYMPSGTDGDTTPRIKGRPFYIVESCPTLGAVGDLVLFDPMSYMVMSNPPRFAFSIHAHWLNDEVIFRVVWRLDGKPKYFNAITPNNGGALQSPMVAIAAR